MELAAQTTLGFDRELVFRTYRDHLADTVDFLPNVSSIVVEQRVEEGDLVRLVNLWTAHTDIPSVAKKFLKPEMLQWTDRAEWDGPSWSCRWHIETHAFPGLVECRGTTTFLESGGGTELRIRGELALNLEKAHVPRLFAGTVRPVIEKVVIGALTPNLLKTGEGIGRYLQAQRGR